MPRAKIALLAAAVLAVGIGGALLLVGSGEPPAADAGAGSRPLIALFAEPAPHGVPYLAQDPHGPAVAGLDLAGARLASTTPAGSHLVAVERDAGRSICIIATDTANPQAGAGSCTTRDAFRREGVFAVLVDDEGREVIGLLPDGVATVVATDATGVRAVVQVSNNAIRLPLAQATIITFSVDGRAVVQDFSATPTDI